MCCGDVWGVLRGGMLEIDKNELYGCISSLLSQKQLHSHRKLRIRSSVYEHVSDLFLFEKCCFDARQTAGGKPNFASDENSHTYAQRSFYDSKSRTVLDEVKQHRDWLSLYTLQIPVRFNRVRAGSFLSVKITRTATSRLPGYSPETCRAECFRPTHCTLLEYDIIHHPLH